jgi:hypothetical protein
MRLAKNQIIAVRMLARPLQPYAEGKPRGRWISKPRHI